MGHSPSEGISSGATKLPLGPFASYVQNDLPGVATERNSHVSQKYRQDPWMPSVYI